MKKIIKVGSDFSGVGAFEQALKRLEIDFETVFACDMDKYARKTYIANYGKPAYYPENVYNREIPAESLDVYMTSPPCQAFSLAGKRLGKDDERGILFFNSHKFIQANKPRFFIFENVKGLLSHDGGKTFQEWIGLLGGKSINGMINMMPYSNAVPYHIYHTVINAKNHNIPQNRERVFIVGIRDDADNMFSWPQEQPLTKRLRDVLEENVDKKYYLSEKLVEKLLSQIDDISDNSGIQVIGNTNPSGNGMNGNVFHENGISPTLSTNKGEGIKVARWQNKQSGVVLDDIAGTLRASGGTDSRKMQHVVENTGAGHNDYVVKLRRTDEAKKKRSESLKNTGKDTGSFADRQYELVQQNYADTILANPNPVKDGLIGVIQLNQSTEFKQRKFSYIYRQTCGCGHNFIGSLSRLCPSCNMINSGYTNELRIKRKRKEVCIPVLTPDRLEKKQNGRRFKEDGEPFFTLTSQDKHGIYNGITIRRLTPTECFRLMGFPDTLVENARTAGISDSQLYKQAGNSIVVDVLTGIISGIKTLIK